MNIKTTARIGGILYLIIIIVGMCGELFVRGRFLVSGDATATAANIKANELLWRMSVGAELFMLSCAIALLLIFYILFKPVNKHLALLVVLFDIVSVTLEIANKMYLLGALFPLGDAEYLNAFEPPQLNAMAHDFVIAHQYGFGVNLIFFGWTCILLGYLIFKSGYFPRVIGILMQIAGVCYLVNSFALIIAPSIASMLFPFIMLPVFVAESSFCVWLILKGVNAAKWQERAKAMAIGTTNSLISE